MSLISLISLLVNLTRLITLRMGFLKILSIMLLSIRFIEDNNDVLYTLLCSVGIIHVSNTSFTMVDNVFLLPIIIDNYWFLSMNFIWIMYRRHVITILFTVLIDGLFIPSFLCTENNWNSWLLWNFWLCNIFVCNEKKSGILFISSGLTNICLLQLIIWKETSSWRPTFMKMIKVIK